MNLYVNLDFEYEYLLGERPTARAIQRQNERWSHIMRLVSGWSDAHPREESCDGPWLPWGITPSFLALNPAGTFPSAEVVRRVNSKVYSSQLESELGVSLPSSSVAESIDELREAVAAVVGDSLVKNPWGVAGRERITTSGTLDDAAIRWAEKQFRLVDELVVEPLVERTRDWSIQFELAETPRMLGALHLVTDAAGNHRGHRLDDEIPGQTILNIALEAAARVHAEGYRGPLGIDAFEGRIGSSSVERALCEINARMTFGRLALELERYVREPFVWWHPPQTFPDSDVDPIEPGAAAGIYRMPEFADPGGQSHSLIVIGNH